MQATARTHRRTQLDVKLYVYQIMLREGMRATIVDHSALGGTMVDTHCVLWRARAHRPKEQSNYRLIRQQHVVRHVAGLPGL